jgi:hypothetical protein
MHSENGIFKTLFGILMWDVLFADIPGVFMTPFQGMLTATTSSPFMSVAKPFPG